MNALRILIVENRSNWQGLLSRILKRLGSDVSIDVASSFGSALQYIADTGYDLVTVDLSLPDDASQPVDTDYRGMTLLRELRESRHNRGCGIVVLTAYPATERTVKALKEHGAFNFVEKGEFEIDQFLQIARSAILDAYLRQAEVRAEAGYHLTIAFNRKHLTSSELVGPDRRDAYDADPPLRFDLDNLARRADGIDLLVRQGDPNMWRMEARAIGGAVCRILERNPRVLGHLTAAQALAKSSSDVWLQFHGPAAGLGVPFELLRSNEEPLCLSHILTRCLVWPGTRISRKTEKFNDFIEDLVASRGQLRILVVGANSDGAIPSAESEAETLSKDIQDRLLHLGIEHKVDLFIGDQASYSQTCEALQHGRYHLFHYAGHGWHEQASPESSGLVLRDDDGLRILSAADLRQLMRDTPLRLVYLSCCLGARNESRVGRGDFHGTLEAVARSDVPFVLGYRWTVADRPAACLATEFYRSLWRTFSPGEALLHARIGASMELEGRDDETWASPVLVAQNS